MITLHVPTDGINRCTNPACTQEHAELLRLRPEVARLRVQLGGRPKSKAALEKGKQIEAWRSGPNPVKWEMIRERMKHTNTRTPMRWLQKWLSHKAATALSAREAA